jgi:DNA repair protein RecO
MEIQKSTGVVLSSRRTGEADFFCTMYTREFGKRDFVFKGLQKSRKRPQIISEPGTTANLIYYFHDEKISYIVNEYNIIKHNIFIRDNLKTIYLLYYVLALIEKTTGYNDSNKSIFELAAAGIDNIAGTDFPEHLSVFFALHLLKLHGILPDFSICKICGKSGYHDFIIDTVDFHPVCAKCAGAVKSRTISLDKSAKEFIFQSLKNKFASINHTLYPSNYILDLLFALTLFIENYYHVDIKPMQLLINELS